MLGDTMETVISMILLIGAMILACIFCTFFIVFNLFLKEKMRAEYEKESIEDYRTLWY